MKKCMEKRGGGTLAVTRGTCRDRLPAIPPVSEPPRGTTTQVRQNTRRLLSRPAKATHLHPRHAKPFGSLIFPPRLVSVRVDLIPSLPSSRLEKTITCVQATRVRNQQAAGLTASPLDRQSPRASEGPLGDPHPSGSQRTLGVARPAQR